MQQSTVLTDGYYAVLEYLKNTNQSEYSCKRYLQAYQTLASFFDENEKTAYNSETTLAFRKKSKEEADNKKISRRQYRLMLRISAMIDDYYNGIPIQLRYSYGNHFKFKLSVKNEALLREYVDWLLVADNSVAGFTTAGREFLAYLQNAAIVSLDQINIQLLSDYLINVSANHAGSMNNVQVGLRSFLTFLQASDRCSCDPNQVMAFKSAPTRRKIYPAFTTEDLKELLAAPNRTTIMGIRDYAVLLLASYTGIRAIDVANLKFDDIDSKTMSINFLQHKTSRWNTLPIDKLVMASIKDYIKVRPDTDNPYLFQTVTKPYRKLNDISSVRNILIKYLRTTSINKTPWDGKGFHAFRRGVGVWLLESSYDTELISQVLGHKGESVLQCYLPLSADSLRKCALGFELAPLQAEVYK